MASSLRPGLPNTFRFLQDGNYSDPTYGSGGGEGPYEMDHVDEYPVAVSVQSESRSASGGISIAAILLMLIVIGLAGAFVACCVRATRASSARSAAVAPPPPSSPDVEQEGADRIGDDAGGPKV
eukprot:805510_1